jgi:hypothetical protein
MRYTILWSVTFAALLSTGPAIADEKPQGTFAFAGTQICLWAPHGFSTDNQGNPVIANDGGTFETSNSFWGLAKYENDGTGTTTGEFTGLTAPAVSVPQPSASGGTFTFQFTTGPIINSRYTTTAVPDTYTGMITAGTRAGQTFKINVLSRVHLISNDKRMITSANEKPYVERITYGNGDFSLRICNVASVGFRLN